MKIKVTLNDFGRSEEAAEEIVAMLVKHKLPRDEEFLQDLTQLVADWHGKGCVDATKQLNEFMWRYK